MAKKKKTTSSEETNGTAQSPSSPAIPPSISTRKPSEPSTSALIICRNKHWRYISSFHGPWLQLPPEVLESLAWSNYMTLRPHPIDPAVFFDLVKIRKAVDDATDLAVRAASGVTSSSMQSNMNAANGMLNGAGAAALGIGVGPNNGSAKLSKERKHRMRELATQKLAQAYQLDEVAASVATMQSASTLEDLAHLVLQRNPQDFYARYVHFFHEKIPSRMMAQCTPLEPLDRLVTEKPMDAPTYRTRALTRMFKDDWAGAAQDLTDGLRITKHMAAQHENGSRELALVNKTPMDEMMDAMRRMKTNPMEQEQPSSAESQMLFHRASSYFTLAYRHVHAALDAMAASARSLPSEPTDGTTPPRTMAEQQAHRRHLELRKMVKSNARRALRDFCAFLSKFDYTPGLAPELVEELAAKMQASANQRQTSRTKHRAHNGVKATNGGNDDASDLLVHVPKPHSRGPPTKEPPLLSPPKVYPISDLFSESLPSDLPPFPLSSVTTLVSHTITSSSSPPHTNRNINTEDLQLALRETMTYHPLLTEALHFILLCHALLQTPPTELRRHAHNTARLARLADGYPVFLAARSPARADWTEILRRTDNWIGLEESWEKLCRPAQQQQQQHRSSLPSPSSSAHSTDLAASSSATERFRGDRSDSPFHRPGGLDSGKSREQLERGKRERRKQEAIMEALADERVVDEETFQRAVRARHRRAIEDELREVGALPAVRESKPDAHTNGNNGSGDDTAADPKGSPSSSTPATPTTPSLKSFDKDYPISSERAEAISRWVRKAPIVVEGTKAKKRAKGKGVPGGEKDVASDAERGKENKALEEVD